MEHLVAAQQMSGFEMAVPVEVHAPMAPDFHEHPMAGDAISQSKPNGGSSSSANHEGPNHASCAECASRAASLRHLWADHQSTYHWAQHLHWTLTKRDSELGQLRQAHSDLQGCLDRAENQLRHSDIEVGRLTVQLRKVEPVLAAYKKSKRQLKSNSTD